MFRSMNRNEDRLLTLREVSRILRLSPPTLYKLLKERRLPGVKVGNQWRFRRAEILRWLEGTRIQAPVPPPPKYSGNNNGAA